MRLCPDYGDNSGCVGGWVDGEGPCKPWLRGPYCRLCNVTDDSRYYDSRESACLLCTGDAWMMPAVMIIVLLVIVAVVLLWCRFQPQ